MAFDLSNLGGHVGDVLRDTREVEDPWGFGIKAVILRASHPDWKRLEQELAEADPKVKRMRQLQAEVIATPLAPAGFRQKRRKSAGEMYRATVEEMAAPSEDPKSDVDTVRERKDGIATILLKSLTVNGETIVDVRGSSIDLGTVEGRLLFLNHAPYQYEVDGDPRQKVVPFYVMNGDGPKLDKLGEPEEARFAGWNIGDGIAAWLLEEADDLAAFSEREGRAVLGKSSATSGGSGGTGSPSPTATADS